MVASTGSGSALTPSTTVWLALDGGPQKPKGAPTLKRSTAEPGFGGLIEACPGRRLMEDPANLHGRHAGVSLALHGPHAGG